MTCCNIEIFLHVSMCSYCQRCSHCSLSGGPNILCVCNGGVQNAYTPPCSLHCWRTCLDGSCSSGRSNIAFPNQVPHQCAHTTPPPFYGLLQAIKPGKSIARTFYPKYICCCSSMAPILARNIFTSLGGSSCFSRGVYHAKEGNRAMRVCVLGCWLQVMPWCC